MVDCPLINKLQIRKKVQGGFVLSYLQKVILQVAGKKILQE